MEAPLGFLPKARRQGIITKEVDGELLIYDLDRDKAHCLNPSAAAIWKLCDGCISINEIASLLASEAEAPFDERAVVLALTDLRRSHLLEESGNNEERFELPETIMGMSRREAVRRIGIGASLPIIFSITAPTARASTSCRGDTVACDTPAQCCSGFCTDGECVGDGP